LYSIKINSEGRREKRSSFYPYRTTAENGNKRPYNFDILLVNLRTKRHTWNLCILPSGAYIRGKTKVSKMHQIFQTIQDRRELTADGRDRTLGAMKLFSSYVEAAEKISTPHVVTIGNFDGVHVGHQALLRAARREADRLGLPLAALTFDPHPAEVLNPDAAPQNLVEVSKKKELLAASGVDTAVFQHFDRAFAALSAEFFAAQILAKSLRARRVTVGGNFRFGKNREAGIDTLTSLGNDLGFEVCAAPLVSQDEMTVSSSQIRTLLSQGDVRRAARLLGRRHEVTGQIIRDRQIGKRFGFPTINLTDTKVLIPKNGIYAAFAQIDERTVKAAAYIGNRPTQNAGFSIEAHLLDFSGDLYDSRATLCFVDWVRGDMKFSDETALIEQIKEDISRIRRILEQTP
jgi:riboflavin kinase / FMN adenylyltransferase